jgi:hypothetical protein
LQPIPADDPFKDEPPKTEEQGDDSAPKPPLSRRPREKSIGQRETIRWRVTAKSASSVNQAPAAESTSSDEPQRLRISNVEGEPASLPVMTQVSNPLRVARRTSDGVQPTASWTAVPASDSGSGVRRTNPLRGN